MADSYYNLQIKDWRYMRSLLVHGQEQDIFRTAQGWLVTVSKDSPLKGWHVSVHTKNTIPHELLEREARRFFDQLELPFVNIGPGPLTGAPNFHENIWSERN